MLQHLSIKNYAIIEKLELDLSKNLTIITGETGSGKSIILGALSLILGQRADSNVLYNKEKKCVIEGHFDIEHYDLENFFQTNDIDYEDKTIIRREIAASGKSRAFINDTPVTLTILKELSNQLVDLHVQHETLSLSSQSFQLKTIDAIADNKSLLSQYKNVFQAYRKNVSELEQLQEEKDKLDQDYEYFQFQLNEFNNFNLENIDQEALEQELKKLNSAEHIKKELTHLVAAFQGDHTTLLAQLHEVNNSLKSLSKMDKDIHLIQERVNSTYLELQDVSGSLESLGQNTNYDEERIDEINRSLDQLYRLQKKHGAQTVEELLQTRDDIQSKLDRTNSSSEYINQLNIKINQQKQELSSFGKQLSENRNKSIPSFEKTINNLLHDVGMPHASIKISNKSDFETPKSTGFDHVQFLFASNKGSEYQDIKKIASGGELSRLMLCIKSQIADSTALPTLIFDEIDTGISGEVALKVGHILEKLAAAHQVVCITHLPQIAGKGDMHYFVYKKELNNRTVTNIKSLSTDERVTELAKMLSGDNPTDAAISNAKELLSF